MPDDNIIRAGVRVDTSELKSGMAQAVQVNKAALDQLKADYESATAAVAEATRNLASAQSQLGAAAASGNAGAIAIIREYEGALEQAATAQRTAAVSVQSLNSALMEEAVAHTEAASAAAVQSGYMGALASEFTRARYAGMLLARDVGVPLPRAITSIASQAEGLGPILTAAFPFAVASFLGVELGKIIVKGYDLYDNWMNLTEASKALGETTSKAFDLIDREIAEANRATEEYLRLTKSASAADQFKIQVEGDKRIDISKLIDTKKLKSVSKDIQNSIAAAFAPGEIKEAGDRVQEIGDRLQRIRELQADFNPMGGKTKKDLEVEQGYLETAFITWKQIADSYGAQALADGAKLEHDRAEEVKRGTEEQTRAYRQREEALAQADREAMSALEVNAARSGTGSGQALVLEKLALLANELAGETAYSDRVRELHTETARLELESAQNFYHGQEEARRSVAELSKQYDEEQKKDILDTTRDLAELTKGYRDQNEELKKQNELITEKLKADSETQVGGLETQKQAEAAQFKTQPRLTVGDLNPLGNEQNVQELARQQDFDRQMLAERLRFATEMAEIDKINSPNDPKKYDQDQQQIVKLQQQANQQQIAQNLQMTTALRAQWTSYFNIVNQGFLNGLNGWIQGNETFEKATRQMLVQLIESFADYYAKKLLLVAENWLQEKVIGQAAQASSGLAAVVGNAAVAAAGAWASTAAIPIVGPELAPEVAASTYASVLAAYGPLASFDVGGIIPNTGIALVHKGEEVITAPVTNMVKNMASNPRTNNLNVNTTIHNSGLTPSTFKSMASQQSGHIANTVFSGLRKMNVM